MATPYPAWIQDRAFGGREVAVSPNSASSEKGPWPDGPSVPGVDSALGRLTEACLVRGAKPRFVFLVGGAGNGKSFMANRTVRAVGARPYEMLSTFAKRSYLYSTPADASLRVVNDATIPADGDDPATLAEEIASSLDSGQHLLACVNRGVLISELQSRHERDGQPVVVVELLRRLLTESSGEAFESGDWKLLPGASVSSSTLDFELVSGAGVSVTVEAVFMDSLSLLEAIPNDGTVEVEAVSSIRPILDNRRYRPRNAAFEKPLSKLCEVFSANMIDGWPAGDLDPVLANVTQLKEDRLADAWARCVRGAEIIDGSNLSYRDLWGLSTLSLVGPSADGDLSRLSSWVIQKRREHQSATSDLERCRALVSLAQFRCHVTLYGGLPMGLPLGAIAWDGVPPANEATAAMRLADPLLDLDPGISRDVFAVLSYLQEGRPVGQRLLELDERIGSAWSPLETELDVTIAKVVDPMARVHERFNRSELLAWYTQYVVRLVALSMGRPAFAEVLTEWQRLKVRADNGEHQPNPILRSLMEVILPRSGSDDVLEASSLMPILKPRVVSLGTSQRHVAMRVKPQDYPIDVISRGEKLIVRLGSGSDVPAETSLDFHLLREALSRKEGQGFTDSLRHVEPRLERLRARILAMQLHGSRGVGDIVFVVGDGRLLPG